MNTKVIKVLLIEDNPGDARLIRETLLEAGGTLFELEWLDRLETGLQRLSGGDIDLVLLDLGLPDSQGLDSLTRVGVQAPHLPILVLTGLADGEVGVQAIAEGAQDYLIKGQVDGSLLVRAIRYAIERKRLQEELSRHRDHLEELVTERTSELENANKQLRHEITERKQAEEELRRNNSLLSSISQAQNQFISEANPSILFSHLLNDVLSLTNSEYGFTGEVLYTSYSKPYLKVHAITNIAWNEETRQFYEKNASTGMEFHNLKTLFGAVMTTGKPVIANDPSTDPRRGGLPEGHPPLNAFLGLPLSSDGKLVGMIGIANRPTGYGEEVVEYLQPFLTTCRNIMAAYRNIQQRRQAEEEIKKFKTIADNAEYGVSISDPEGKLTYVNEAYAKMHGYKSDKVIGKHFSIFYTTAQRKIIERRRKKIFQTGSSIDEVWHRRKDGTTFPTLSTSTVVKDDKEKILYIAATHFDLTERKKMEEQLMVTDRLASIGELVSGIAHEINNPLTGIIGFSEILLDRKVPDDIKEDLTIINKEAQRTARIVKNLLTFARKQPQEKGLFNINDTISKVLELRAYEQKVQNIEVNRQFAPDLPEVMANAFQLQQVFLNLVINAEYFMIEAHGRGTLTITTERVDNTVRASFADDGPGISKENMDHLFDPFFTTKEVGKGTGLGLSICHGIITEQGGRIYVESKRGKGATFIIELPLSEPRRGGGKSENP